jgi:hypothetical protein
MAFPLKERIGAWELFTNRQEELEYFDSWIGDIEKKAAISTAVVGHRKVGKTALLQRLYNRLFRQKGKVIPFLFEIEEQNRQIDEFSRVYYMSFVSQLLSFKKRQWLGTTNSLEKDFLELGYKFSNLYDTPVTEECLLLAHRLLAGHPAYLRDIFNSKYEGKDLTTTQGLYETYLFEVGKPKQGRILAGWEEYLDLAFDQINQYNAKKIVLFLARHSEREWSRMEIKERCGLHEMTDQELERKLQALVVGDLIAPGHSSFYYQGLGDPTFEKVFRLKYQEEIEQIEFNIIKQDIIAEFQQKHHQLKEELAAKTQEANRLRGALNQKKGEAGELWIKSIIRRCAHDQRYFAPGELGNNAEKIRFPRFKEIDAHVFTSRSREIKLDILCYPAQTQAMHLAVEVKNREAQKVSAEEVKKFAEDLQALQEHWGAAQLQGLFYSFNGFEPEAIAKLGELKIFWWDFDTLERLS